MAVVEEKKTTDTSPSATDSSMEDILTTIRNVIAGDETTAPAAAAPEDILELTEVVKEGKSVPPPAAPPTPTPPALASTPAADTTPPIKPEDVMKDIAKAIVADTAAAPAPAPSATNEAPAPAAEIPNVPPSNPAPQEAPAASENPAVSALLSDATVKISSETLKTFATLVAAHQNGLKFRSGMTLEEIVMEALKPQLGQWLDKHLPQMVMRVVEREIQKLLPNDE